MNQVNVYELPVGSVLRVSHGAYDHVGMVSDGYLYGERAIISLSGTYGRVIEEPYSSFSAGRVVQHEGYPGQLPPHVVVYRARALVGRPYSVTSFNCEHYVRCAH
jgi:hypothetical protein